MTTLTDQFRPATATRRGQTLRALMRGRRLLYASAVASLLFASAVSFAPPLILRAAIDGVIGGKPIDAPRGVLELFESLGGSLMLSRTLWVFAALLFAAAIAEGAFTYLKGRWSAIAAEAIARHVRDHLYDRLQHLPCRYYDEAETGDLVQRCTSDVETVRMFLATQVVELARAAANFVVVVPIVIWLDWRMAIAATAVMPIIVVFSIVFFLIVKRSFKAADEAEGALTSVIQENLTGIRVVRAFANQAFECDKLERRNADHRDKDLHLYKVFAWYWSLSDAMVFVQMGLALFTGAYLVTNGQITIGTLVAFWMIVGIMIWPVRQMGRILSLLGKALVSLQRVNEVLAAPVEPDPGEPHHDLPPRLGGGLVFDGVRFGHAKESPVVRGVSFAVEPGQTLAILGPSGSGKSTIVNLLLRFYDYDGGHITIDGFDLSRLPRQYVRRQIGVVMQEPFLYSKTVRDNVKIGRHEAPEEEMIHATQLASVHEAIEQFDTGYDTLVGERGVTLSGGQRQRIALARALLQEPPILILDDAFSAVDTHTEARITEALRRRSGRYTTLLIAHRLSTLRQADRVIVLEDGCISQSGTHDELIKADGLYRRLWRIQGGSESGRSPLSEQQDTEDPETPEAPTES